MVLPARRERRNADAIDDSASAFTTQFSRGA
jgi:hypothetical protein